jgi:hypothetical protein
MDLNGLTADQKYKLQCWIEEVWIENALDDYPSWLFSLHIDLMADLEDWEGKDQLSRLRLSDNVRKD